MPGIEQQGPRRTAEKGLNGFPPSKFLKLPSSIRNIFDAFPWVTYGENVLPQRSALDQSVNNLYVFTADGERFSPNPACLKWQAYLMIKGVPFHTVDANNHASPTGALPFILPARKPSEPQPQAIVSSKIQRWVETQTSKEDQENVEDRILMSLIEQNVRTAWLFFVYLKTENFQSIANVLYIHPASRNLFVRKILSYQLTEAAREQVIKANSRIDETEILLAAERAFKALNQTLKDHDFFSKSREPGVLDCAVFSYTYLIMKFVQPENKDAPTWKDGALAKVLSKYGRLTEHTARMENLCFAKH